MFGVQVPNMVQVPVQSACNVSVQLPSVWQHEPLGSTQGFGLQTPNAVQVAVQSACNVSKQLSSGWQHEPLGCGQVFGVQVPDAVQVAVQSASAVTAQEPSTWQHEPVGGPPGCLGCCRGQSQQCERDAMLERSSESRYPDELRLLPIVCGQQTILYQGGGD